MTLNKRVAATGSTQQAWDDQIDGTLRVAGTDRAALRSAYFNQAHASRGPEHAAGEEHRMELLELQVSLMSMMGFPADTAAIDQANAMIAPSCCY